MAVDNEGAPIDKEVQTATPGAEGKPEVLESVEGSESVVVDPEGDGTTGDDGADDKPADERPQLKYEGQDVEVEIPDDLVETFKAQGLDAQALANELYSGEEFGLSEETKAGLYKLYGKTVVEGYLEGLKARNDSVFSQLKQQQQQAEEANEKIWNETLELVGGEEGWNGLEEYALEKLSDEELDEFNQVMASGSRYAQKLALKDLKARREGTEGTGELELVEGDSRSNSDKGFLSKQEYLELHTSGEYRKDPKKYDSLRQAGMARGL